MSRLESIEVTRLRWFVAVAEELHFARAAKALRISRQRLSNTVIELENELGTKLFVPGAQPTRLTDDGRELLGEAKEFIARAAEESEPEAVTLRIGYVPGVTVAKWSRIWAERYPDIPLELIQLAAADQERALREGRVDMCFVRLPIDRAGLSAIPLYHELPVAVVQKDHPISLFDEIALADLSDETRQDVETVDAAAGTLEIVAAVGGFAIVPHSIARLHHRRDLIYRTVTDLPGTEVALAWLTDRTTEQVEDFIGVVRGRSERSSRSKNTAPQPVTKKQAEPKRKAPAKRTPAKGQPRRRGR
ncbi:MULTISPECIES: LysR family transcriptional regulator [unclassified Nocardia]|uniref:LysR family transcriptional regulator n=1 Tax=unclassified Nocardia TaxID=2637762 RepID=UPI001CE44B02|nr:MULTISPECIES: LysR substrate-binding domain-containing protein [unclassified Nocardia]